MTLTSLSVNLLALIVGFVLGLLVQWRQQEVKGKIHLIPTFVLTGKRVDLVLALGVIVAITGTVLLGIDTSRHNRECNLRLWEAIDARVYSSENARQANSELINQLFVEGPTVGRERAEVIEEYRVRQAEIDQYLAEHPIPPPMPGCGL